MSQFPTVDATIFGVKEKHPGSLWKTLRADQQEQTRNAIFSALAAHLAESDLEDLSFPRIAKLAGISVRTLYRHYPSKGALLEAFGDWSLQLPGLPREYPPDWQEFPSGVMQLFAGFDRHEALVRAELLTRRVDDTRDSGRRKRMKRFRAAIDPIVRSLPEEDRIIAAAVLHVLFSAQVWFLMREYWALSGEDAGRGAAWALDVLTNELRRNPRDPITPGRGSHRRGRSS